MAEASTVFVVDDDAAVRKALTRSLSKRGYRVETFASAEAFLDAYRPEQPGCMVLDVRMPGMSGLELQGFTSTVYKRIGHWKQILL